MTEIARIRRYMNLVKDDYRDPITGEVNATRLAEDACMFFDDYGPPPDFDVPEKYYEVAAGVSDDWRKGVI